MQGAKLRAKIKRDYLDFDQIFIWLTLSIIAFGLVMVFSSSIAIAQKYYHNPLYFFLKQLFCVVLGLLIASFLLFIRSTTWDRIGISLLFVAIEILVLVLIFGVSVNGSKRWINLGLINIQGSEVAKLFLIIYLSGYLARCNEELRQHLSGFIKPMIILTLYTVLLLLEPDFGATIVIFITSFAMMFYAGAKLRQFVILSIIITLIITLLAIESPYRLQRLFSFTNPWQDQFGKGYQLVQALISFGRGHWLGMGLGNSIQKLFFLPEAHTDFIFAVIAEELGLIGIIVFLSIYTYWLATIFMLAQSLHKRRAFFGSYLAFGLGIYFAAQASINIGVNLGLLPTKGLTLPLVSYGGSSMLVSCASIGILLRLFVENKQIVQKRKMDYTKVLSG